MLFHDLFSGELRDEFNEFKRHGGRQRALNIKPLDEGGYRLSIMNINGDVHKQSLYFDITTRQARELAITVLDHVRNYDQARALAQQIVTPI